MQNSLGREFNTDSRDGEVRRDRFTPAFVGATLQKVTDDLDTFNQQVAKLWDQSENVAMEALDEILRNPEVFSRCRSLITDRHLLLARPHSLRPVVDDDPHRAQGARWVQGPATAGRRQGLSCLVRGSARLRRQVWSRAAGDRWRLGVGRECLRASERRPSRKGRRSPFFQRMRSPGRRDTHAEIAVIAAKQLDAYAATLMSELDSRGVSYRNEAQDQDTFAEPIVRLIYDLLTVVTDRRQPEEYRRLIAATERLAGRGADSEPLITQVIRCVQPVTAEIASGAMDCTDLDTARGVLDSYIDLVGIHAVRGWSSGYAHGTGLNDLIEASYARYGEHIQAGSARRGAAQTGRHHSDTATYRAQGQGPGVRSGDIPRHRRGDVWGNPDEERAVFFVGISRAKRHLLLTTATTRSWPDGVARWHTARTPHEEFLSCAN
jgi:hypothetical protein